MSSIKTNSMEMQIVARLTKEAKVSTTKTGKQVINFDVAVNETFKVKATGELKTVVQFVRCSYWLNSGIASYLTKGKLVLVKGDIGVEPYLTKNGQPAAALTLRVFNLRLLDKNGEGNRPALAQQATATGSDSQTDDLPF